MLKRIKKWWFFTFRNPVVRSGEVGAFRYVFRRFTLDIKTISSNFRVIFTASENPYAYLVSGKDESNIHGFAEILYEVAMLLTTDQGFAGDVIKALQKYSKRLEKRDASEVVEDETEEKIALEEVKAVQEHVELPKKERKKVERGIDGRFKKAVKEVQKNEA